MHTVLVLAGGFFLLALCVSASRFSGLSRSMGAIVFIPLWFVLAAFNLWVGVTRAGYTVAQEFPIFILVFGLPALVALVVWWKLSAPQNRGGTPPRG